MKWRYPLSDIALGIEEEKAIIKVLRSRWLSLGPITEKFEKAFAKYLGGGEAIAVSNGTAALHLVLASLDLKRGDEVILPSLTFVATANAVLYTGAIPVFADIKGLDNLNISPEAIERKITKRTKAIIVMHYGGNPCDMISIMGIARRHHLYVVEDAAHAPGAEYQGEKCGTIGDLGCFSFFSNKNMATGEGGLVFTRHRGLAEKVRMMRSHGMRSLSWDKYRGRLASYDIEQLGFNYRITEIQSALGLVQLKKLDRNNRKRKKLVEAYQKELEGLERISIPFFEEKGRPAYHLFVIILKHDIDRGKVMEALKAHGIQTSVHYPAIHLFSLYRNRFGCKEGMLPKTEEVSRKELTLPLHPLMNVEDVKGIAKKVKNVIGES